MTPDSPTDAYLLGEALADCRQDLEMAELKLKELFTGPLAIHDTFYRLCLHFDHHQRAELVRLLLRSLPNGQLAEIVLDSSEADALLAKQIYNDQRKTKKA